MSVPPLGLRCEQSTLHVVIAMGRPGRREAFQTFLVMQLDLQLDPGSATHAATHIAWRYAL